MRPFLFTLPFLISLNAWAAPCTTADLTGGGTVNCDSLTINAPLTLDSSVQELVVNVTGDVDINFPITLSGANGASGGDPTSGGVGGPGASDGGGYAFGPQAASDTEFPASTSLGQNSNSSAICAGGGGGGGMVTAGDNGTDCGGGGSLGGTGGTAVIIGEFSFGGNFRGGFGGGSGADGAGVLNVGTGGGGGGSIHITAGGNVTITANILAKGGNGGNAINAGGAGGGGSGGIIWIESSGNITNSATINADGGIGGIAVAGGNGGNGGRGAIRLDAAGVVTNTGTLPGYAVVISAGAGGTPTSSAPGLHSAITCGSMSAKNENHQQLFQMVLGFLLVLLITYTSSQLQIKLLRRDSFNKSRRFFH